MKSTYVRTIFLLNYISILIIFKWSAHKWNILYIFTLFCRYLSYHKRFPGWIYIKHFMLRIIIKTSVSKPYFITFIVSYKTSIEKYYSICFRRIYFLKMNVCMCIRSEQNQLLQRRIFFLEDTLSCRDLLYSKPTRKSKYSFYFESAVKFTKSVNFPWYEMDYISRQDIVSINPSQSSVNISRKERYK